MPYACWPFSDVSPYRILSLRTIKSSIWPRPAPIFHRIRQKSATTPRVIPSESAHLHNYFEAVSHFERQLLTRRPAGSSRANQADQWRKHGRVTATEVADPNLLLAHQIRFQRETLGGGTRVRGSVPCGQVGIVGGTRRHFSSLPIRNGRRPVCGQVSSASFWYPADPITDNCSVASSAQRPCNSLHSPMFISIATTRTRNRTATGSTHWTKSISLLFSFCAKEYEETEKNK